MSKDMMSVCSMWYVITATAWLVKSVCFHMHKGFTSDSAST